MAIRRADVEHVAKLARLALSEEELGTLEEQLSRILDHAARVTALDTDGIEPTAHAIPLVNVLRADEIVPPLDPAEALRNAPDVENGYFRIPKILEEGV